ncbi:MAG: M penetrans family 1 protein [Chryseobacterium sp.]|nr:MAG: M penetrans family 1 protein [Chryseobacterium sp.]
MKKSIFILSLGILLISFFSFNDVDFFSSMTKVDYIDGTKTLKFTTKLNTSHVSQATKIDPNTAGFEAEVKKYVNNNVDVAVNGAPKALTFTGSQVNGESVWVYYEVGNISDISSLKIKNSILIGQFPKQVNIMNITYKGNLKTVNFQKGKESAEVTF